MTDNAPSGHDPGPDELREQARATREELAHTVEALAAKADVKAQGRQKAAETKAHARQKAAETKAHARQKAAEAKHQVHDTTAHALQAARDRTPEPVREKATHAATAANEHRGLVLAALAAAAAVVTVLLCRKRGGR
jgi:FtsZ-interacting cell division protein ZipA